MNSFDHLDVTEIERQAQRLRAEAMRSGVRTMGSWLRARFHTQVGRRSA